MAGPVWSALLRFVAAENGPGSSPGRRRTLNSLQPSLDQPLMEDLHRTALQVLVAADKPVAVGTLDIDVVEHRQPVVARAAEVVVVHDGDAEALRGRLEDQLARVEPVDRGRLQLLHAQGRLPRVE